jgi:hypothetical protein
MGLKKQLLIRLFRPYNGPGKGQERSLEANALQKKFLFRGDDRMDVNQSDSRSVSALPAKNKTGSEKPRTPCLIAGQHFNPFNVFTGLHIPEVLARYRGISPLAKIAWGRLARYSGRDGRCFPSVQTLGAEIGVGERWARKVLAELEHEGFIRREYQKGAVTQYVFLLHAVLLEAMVPVPLDVLPSPPADVTDLTSLGEICRKTVSSFDDDAVRRLWAECRSRAADCTPGDIERVLAHESERILRRGKRIENAVGLLLKSLPKFFEGQEPLYRKLRKETERLPQQEQPVTAYQVRNALHAINDPEQRADILAVMREALADYKRRAPDLVLQIEAELTPRLPPSSERPIPSRLKKPSSK